jgi:exopolysaccharide biosynthesis polyprenyl glycosylphosphotransferase
MTDAKPRLPFLTLPLGRRPRLRLVERAEAAILSRAADAPAAAGPIWARRYRSKLRLTDVSVIMAAVTIALLARIDVETTATPVGSFRIGPGAACLLVIATWIVTLGTFHTRDSRVVGVGAAEYKRVVSASAVAFGLLAMGFLLLDIVRGYFVLALPLGVSGLTLERWLWRRWLLHQRRFDHYLARAIVVGKREDVEYVVGQIDQKSGAAYCIVGVALESGVRDGLIVGEHRVPVVADMDHVATAAAGLGVDTVIVAGHPSGGSTFIRNLGWDLEGTSAELVLSSRLTDVAGPRIHFRPVEGLPLIHVEIPQFEGGKHVLKRALDVAMCVGAILLLLPLLTAVAIAIRMESPGAVIFRQERVGRNGRTFRMLKFRSMVHDAEDRLAQLCERNQGSGPLFKIKGDPRVTRVGRVLRKYSLDELPQLWNVLVGDMSLVGPRPPLPAEVRRYENHVRRRLYIKPGLTGMWQVNGRSDLTWEESVRLDLYYVENWSLTGDLIILWRTFKVVVNPVGAY